jgi:hypothetical protein
MAPTAAPTPDPQAALAAIVKMARRWAGTTEDAGSPPGVEEFAQAGREILAIAAGRPGRLAVRGLAEGEVMVVTGRIVSVDRRVNEKSGNPWAIVTLDSGGTSVEEVPFFPDAYARYGDALVAGAQVTVKGRATEHDGEVSLFADELTPPPGVPEGEQAMAAGAPMETLDGVMAARSPSAELRDAADLVREHHRNPGSPLWKFWHELADSWNFWAEWFDGDPAYHTLALHRMFGRAMAQARGYVNGTGELAAGKPTKVQTAGQLAGWLTSHRGAHAAVTHLKNGTHPSQFEERSD